VRPALIDTARTATTDFTAARSSLCGATTACQHVGCIRGDGTSAVSLAIESIGSITTRSAVEVRGLELIAHLPA
jgi:hypothetical protein